MKIELDLYTPAELDAFAAFCTAVATHSRERMKSDADRLESYGGIVGLEGWKNQTDKASPGPAIKVPDEPITDAQAEALVAEATGKPQRERGKPSPGHARRTKAEIAEDEAADAADAAVKMAGEEHGGIVADKVVEDSPEDAAQDAADEAAETAATRQDGKLTLDDLRPVSGAYARKYGVAAAAEDVRQLIGCPLIECPEDKIADAIKAINEATEANPFGREVKNGDVTTEPAKATPATAKKEVTKQDLIDKMMEYALLYDGQTENTSPAAMPITFADVTECFRRRFGDDTKKLSDLKPAQYEQALLDITSMLEKNPFDRKPAKKAA